MKSVWKVEYYNGTDTESREYLADDFYKLEEAIQASLSPDQFSSIYEIEKTLEKRSEETK